MTDAMQSVERTVSLSGPETPPTPRMREAYRRVAGRIIAADNRSQFDDKPVGAEAAVIDTLRETGWELLGYGSTRLVLRPPERLRHGDVVVKVARAPEDTVIENGTAQNYREHSAWAREGADHPVFAPEDAAIVDDAGGAVFQSGQDYQPALENGPATVDDFAWVSMIRVTPLSEVCGDGGVMGEWALSVSNTVRSRLPHTYDCGDVVPPNIGVAVADPDDVPPASEVAPEKVAEIALVLDYGTVRP